MTLSIIIPVYNESKYIAALLDSLLTPDGIEKEIFLVDGGSTDGTLEQVATYQQQHPNIIVVHNEKKFVSFGFNKAFPITKGKYITLMGAHAKYPPAFFSTGISHLERDECDAVGGPLLQDGKTSTGKAIAYCMSAKFGVGGTEFRTERKKMYVDSVAFAIYKRTVFEKSGLLDEELIRNQDDELHYRLNAAGYRILMIPEMECTYFVRDSLKGLFKQYFQYGIYKPLVLKKVSSGIRIRHLVPAAFTLYLLSLPLAVWFPAWLIPLALYLLLDLYFSMKSKTLGISQKLTCLLIFPALHLSYGTGFMLGFKKIF